MPDDPLYLPRPDTVGAEGAPHDAPSSIPPAAEACQNDRASGEDAPGKRRATGGGRRRAQAAQYPDEETCLAAIGRLPGLVALGILTTSRANSIRAALAEILRSHRSAKGAREQKRVDDESLLTILRTNPELLSLVEPLLTDEQIAFITGAAGAEENDGPA